MTAFRQRVRAVIARLEPGEIVSYGEVAAAAGSPGAARAVGRVLRGLDGVAWWRVVGGDGRLVAPDAERQARLLAAEGVRVHRGRAVAGPGAAS
ncbi:MAG TPA: MGMT family protein [Egibacteraceae bacterium]|nr:MGMT family protein [Egibacteraceae bacterium]